MDGADPAPGGRGFGTHGARRRAKDDGEPDASGDMFGEGGFRHVPPARLASRPSGASPAASWRPCRHRATLAVPTRDALADHHDGILAAAGELFDVLVETETVCDTMKVDGGHLA